MAVRPLVNAPDLHEHTGFILAEDEMLKSYLSGIQVPGRDETSPLVDVGVWFRWPEGERQIKYPFITIDLAGAEPAFDLFHSDHYESTVGLYQPDKAPLLPAPPDGWGRQEYKIRNFLPFRITYQVVVHARSALHDRYLQSIFKTDVFPVRPFWLWSSVDETWRRTELVSSISTDGSETTESGTKRIFRTQYSISVMAEVPQDRIVDAYGWRVLRVLIPVVDRAWVEQYRQSILDNEPDPIGSFTQEEREVQGEFFHVWHEGKEFLPPPL